MPEPTARSPAMGRIQRKNLAHPDEVRPYDHGVGSLTRVGTLTLGRAELEPGWRWSTHMGPVMGTPSCPVHHVQLLVSGRFGVRMDDGEELVLEPNDVADIRPVTTPGSRATIRLFSSTSAATSKPSGSRASTNGSSRPC